jgi:hypothetical protein
VRRRKYEVQPRSTGFNAAIVWPRLREAFPTTISRTLSFNRFTLLSAIFRRGEARFKLRLEDLQQRLLYQTVQYRRDGQSELHTRSTSIWVGRRSVIHFVRSRANGCRC